MNEKNQLFSCTVRTINRLIVKYKNDGKQGFVHNNKTQLSATTIPLDVKNYIIKLYLDKFTDAVDDATNEVVGAYFDYQETLNGYYNIFHQILTNYVLY